MMEKITPRISVTEVFDIYKENNEFQSLINKGYFSYNTAFFYTLIHRRDAGPENTIVFRTDEATGKKIYNAADNKLAIENTEELITSFYKLRGRKNIDALTANETIRKYMDLEHWNSSIFKEKTLLSDQDYSRLKKDDYIFKKEAYVAMAIGLRLSLLELEKILSKAGICLVKSNDTDIAYSFVVSTMATMGIDECNNFLAKVGVEPLGTKTRK